MTLQRMVLDYRGGELVIRYLYRSQDGPNPGTQARTTLFETPYPLAADDAEKAQIRALRRGAYDSVYGSVVFLEPEEAREELDRLLARAERTQDPELADAVYHVATERGERTIADAYLEARPKAKGRWEEYVAARTEANQLQDPMQLIGRGLIEGALSADGQ